MMTPKPQINTTKSQQLNPKKELYDAKSELAQNASTNSIDFAKRF